MTGMSMARRMRSGTGVGPGICRKWRPAVRAALLTMGLSLSVCQDGVTRGSRPRIRKCIMNAKYKMVNATGHRSEEHTSELQSLMRISYAVFCLKKKNHKHKKRTLIKKKQ